MDSGLVARDLGVYVCIAVMIPISCLAVSAFKYRSEETAALSNLIMNDTLTSIYWMLSGALATAFKTSESRKTMPDATRFFPHCCSDRK